jgi:folate-dependent phosphoribosylglycinamide formyltransferase PurN
MCRLLGQRNQALARGDEAGKAVFETCADKWMEHVSAVGKTIHPSDLPMAEGMCAFAIEQASQFQAMQSHCEHVWHYVAACMRLGQGEIVPEEAQAHDDDDDIMTDWE